MINTIVPSRNGQDPMTPETFSRAIVSIERNYGLKLDARSVWLHFDDWKRLGRDQMGQKCGRGWQGLRGACKRVPKGGDKEAAIKASKVALADKIRKKKGLRDRNVPKAQRKVEKAKTKEAPPKVNPVSIPVSAAIDDTINTGIAKYKVVKKLGKGAFGTAVLTDRGTVVKIANGSLPTKLREAKAEFEGLKQFAKLGIGPEAIGINGTTIEMGLVSGQTISALGKSGISVDQHRQNQMITAKALLKLHNSGWAHNDAHSQNLIIDDNGEAKLLDAGRASKVGGVSGDGTGYHDMVRALEGHPSLALLTEAMEPHELAYRREHHQVFQTKDRSTIGPNLAKARTRLHDEYLKMSSKFIK